MSRFIIWSTRRWAIKTLNLAGIGWVLLLFSSLGLWINAEVFQNSLRPTQSFQRTLGKIRVSRLDSYRRRKRGLGWGQETAYSPEIRYRYRVGTRTYEGKRIDFDVPASQTDPTEAQNQVDKYPAGQTVAVFYAREEPSFAVLQLDQRKRTQTMLCVTASMWLLGLLLVLRDVLHTVRRRIARSAAPS